MIGETNDRSGSGQPAHFNAGIIRTGRFRHSYFSVLYFKKIITVAVINSYKALVLHVYVNGIEDLIISHNLNNVHFFGLKQQNGA